MLFSALGITAGALDSSSGSPEVLHCGGEWGGHCVDGVHLSALYVVSNALVSHE